MTTDEFMKEVQEFFEDICEQIDFEYEHKDGKDAEKLVYNFDDNRKKENEQSKCDNELRNLLSLKYKEIEDLKKENESLKKKNQAILEVGKKVSEDGHKILEDAANTKDCLRKMFHIQGCEIVGKIKSYIENARYCGLDNDVNFLDSMNSIAKTANDYNLSRNRKSACWETK